MKPFDERLCEALYSLLASGSRVNISSLARRMNIDRRAIYYHLEKRGFR